MKESGNRSGVIWFLFWVLFLAHHDFWFWDNKSMVFGFLPAGLAYHALFSIMAGCLWAAACRFAWPTHIEQWADEPETGTSSLNTKS